MPFREIGRMERPKAWVDLARAAQIAPSLNQSANLFRLRGFSVQFVVNTNLQPADFNDIGLRPRRYPPDFTPMTGIRLCGETMALTMF